MSLLEKTGDFGADLNGEEIKGGIGDVTRTYLPSLCEGIRITEVGESDERFVALERMRHYGEEGFNVEHEGGGKGGPTLNLRFKIEGI